MLKIRERRYATNPKITLKEISEISGISISRIQNLETDLEANPTVKTIRAIKTALSKLEFERKLECPTQ